MIGATVDQFKIAKTLAKSAVGDVFLAVHGQTGANFVLQSIDPALVSQAGFRKIFLEDASQLIKFEHPNVVPLVNVLEENGRLYLVREYFEGLSLSEMVLNHAGRLSLGGVLRLFKDVLRGIGYAHAEGAVHKFLNPKNILVTSDGEAKIIGFGRVLPEAEERLMKPDDRAFAARYFSPERIRNPNTTDIRANIYALGAILYELVTGKPPFSGNSFELQAKQHIEAGLPDPTLLNPSMPLSLAKAMTRALAKRPENRFQNTIEFYKALEQVEQQIKAKSEKSSSSAILGASLVDSPDTNFQFGLPNEVQEGEFQFDLGSEIPAEEKDSKSRNIPQSPEAASTGLDDPFGAEEVDVFSPENLASGHSSLDFSGFGAEESSGGLFDLDVQKEIAGKGVLDFSVQSAEKEQADREKDPSIDLDRLSFGQKTGSAEGAFDLGELDAVNTNLSDGLKEETVQASPRSSGLGSGDQDGLELGISNQAPEIGSGGAFSLNEKPSASSNGDVFDLDTEFPSEKEEDPFASLEESAKDMDLSFKDKDLGSGMSAESADIDLDFKSDDLFANTEKGDPSYADQGLSLGLADAIPSSVKPASDPTPFAEDEPFTTEVDDEDDSIADFKIGDFAESLDQTTPEVEQVETASLRTAAMPEDSQSLGDSATAEDDSISRQRLETSLAKIEAADAAAQAEKSSANVKVKKVRKLDKKLLMLTASLAAIIVLAFLFWMNQQQKKRTQERTITEIQELVDQRQYSQALQKISDFMGRGSSDRFTDLLSDVQRQIRGEQRQIKEQVQTLTERAKGMEAEDALLIDGKSDAYAAYQNILSLDPQNKVARDANSRIRELQLAKASSFLESERKVDALAIYAALSQGNRGDRETKQRYQALKAELKESRSGALIAEIETLYSKKDFDGITSPFLELNQIDPKSDFVIRMRRTLVGDLVSRSKESLALHQYEVAESSLRFAAKLDPNNKEIAKLLGEMGEERLRGDIEKAAVNLARAITGKDFGRQYRLSNELLAMDPGNRTAISALDTVNAHVQNLTKKGDEMREVGNFKAAASVYRQIYLINKNEQARVLWGKYDNWTPPAGMAYIPAGSFRMGKRASRDAFPEKDIYISSYFLDKYEVTNGEYKVFVDANPRWKPDRINASLHDGNYLKHWRNGRPLNDDLNRPVTYVSWYAATAYAAYKNKRLPSEAEWEKGAGGNTVGKKYWWGNYSDAKMAVYEFYKEKLPAPVGKFPANGFGVYEILGNVNEWTQDSYDPSFYRTNTITRNPINSDSTKPKRVFRGGSFRSRGRDLMIYLRSHGNPKLCHATIGFRCAMNSKTF